jgi:hypothetical protein
VRYKKAKVETLWEQSAIFHSLIDDLLHNNPEIILTRTFTGRQSVIIELPCSCKEYQFTQLLSPDCFYEASYYFCAYHKKLLNE